MLKQQRVSHCLEISVARILHSRLRTGIRLKALNQ